MYISLPFFPLYNTVMTLLTYQTMPLHPPSSTHENRLHFLLPSYTHFLITAFARDTHSHNLEHDFIMCLLLDDDDLMKLQQKPAIQQS